VNLPQDKGRFFMPLTLVLSVGLDPVLLATRNQVLKSAGYIVVSAASVAEAADRFRSGDFDLLVLCHSVPAIERRRLTCLIRASGSRIPVVTVSARQYQWDDFADVTLDHDPQEFLRGVEAVLLGQAGAWTTGMDLPGEKQETPRSERSFGVLAPAGWHATAS
jgi:CheY-like chemotaxis protein